MTLLSDVVGQEDGVRYLRRIVEGRLVAPLLFVGVDGVGRRFSVVQAAKEAFCQMGEPGCRCLDCTQIDQGAHPDFYCLSVPEDKRIEVDMIRDLCERSTATPTQAMSRYIIIDGADRMNTAAANAFLKTLEEPSPKVRFFLLAQSYDSVLPTIQSRCGMVPYRPLPESFVLSVLLRQDSDPESDPVKRLVYARMGEGSVGRAVTYRDSGRLLLRSRVLELVQLALAKDTARLFSLIDQVAKDNDLALALRFLEQVLLDILMVQHDPERLINVDLREEVSRLSKAAPLIVWAKLGSGARGVASRARMTRINFGFHVKTLFAETFTGV